MNETIADPVLAQPSAPINSTGYDILTRIPVVVLFAFFTWAAARNLWVEVAALQVVDTASVLQLLARAAGFSFVLLVTVALAVRLPPVARRGGVLPRVTAVAGAFSLMVLVLFPKFDMPPAMSALSFALIITGHALSCYALLHLGRALSILAEARRLVTSGPYAFVRHPLYAAEAMASFGLLLQYWSAPAFAVWACHIALQFSRMRYEEQILRQTFPEYSPYAQRTARVIPNVF